MKTRSTAIGDGMSKREDVLAAKVLPIILLVARQNQDDIYAWHGL